jgi:predicted ATPase/DNA-binding CsgD family transcriptional regulator
MLLEREELLDSLAARLAEAAAGTGRLVFVGGEAGAGKTMLIAEFSRVEDSAVRVLRGTADSPTTAAPLGPFLDALADELPRLERLLDDRPRLFPAVRAALAETPTLLVLEDLHWADEATLDLLGYLGRRLDGLPVLILGTFRDDEVGPFHPLTLLLGDLATRPGVARLHVPGLTASAVHRLVVESGSPVNAQALHRRTGGNPFYVTEVLATGDASLPPSVRDATLARAARLATPARRVLEAASVVEGGVELDLLRHVSGQPDAAIDECCELGLLIGGGPQLQFRHELARQAIESSLPAATRAGLHAATLARLRAVGSEDDRRLAHHAIAGGDASAVIVHADRAGDRAARLGAHLEAAEMYRAVLRHAGLLSRTDRARVLERLSYECYLTDQLAAAVDAQVEALELHRAAGDPVRVGVAERWLSRLSWFFGRNADAERYATQALATLEPLGPSVELATAYSNLSQLRMLANNTAEAMSWGRKAIELARRFGDRAVECSALNNVGTALGDGGDIVDGITQLKRSLDIAFTLDAHEHVARAYCNLGSICVKNWRLVEADQQLQAGINYCRERDLDSWRLYMRAWLARSLTHQARWDEAEAVAADVLRQPHLSPITRMATLVATAGIAVRRGTAGASAILDEALDLAGPTGEAQRIAPVVAVRAEAAWTAGRDVAAELVRADGLTYLTGWESGELAWWAQRSGIATAVPTPCAEPFELMLTGRTAEAARTWSDLGSPFWQALALIESDRPANVRQGVELLRAIGALATVDAVLRDLHAAGKPMPRGPRPASRANPAGLTDREFEVLGLLAAGLSNADIAARLYLSEKTASHHVSAVLRKLREPTRSLAVAAARRRGIVPT